MQKPSPEPQIGSRTISRVLYHSALAGGMATVIPLGAQLPVPSSNLPGSVDRADPLPYLVLLRTGLAELVTSPCRLVGSYPTVSPLPPEGGGLLSVALSEDHSPWALPSVLPCEARTFLTCSLSVLQPRPFVLLKTLQVYHIFLYLSSYSQTASARLYLQIIFLRTAVSDNRSKV